MQYLSFVILIHQHLVVHEHTPNETKENVQIHSRNSQQCFLINHSVHICYDFVKLEDLKPKIIHLVICSVLQTKGTSARNKKEEKKGAKEAENSLELIPRWRT